jgi:hypothetical protein
MIIINNEIIKNTILLRVVDGILYVVGSKWGRFVFLKKNLKVLNGISIVNGIPTNKNKIR